MILTGGSRVLRTQSFRYWVVPSHTPITAICISTRALLPHPAPSSSPSLTLTPSLTRTPTPPSQMRELVKLAEAREAAAKSEIGKMLEARSVMYERTEGSRELDGAADEQVGKREVGDVRCNRGRKPMKLALRCDKGRKPMMQALKTAKPARWLKSPGPPWLRSPSRLAHMCHPTLPCATLITSPWLRSPPPKSVRTLLTSPTLPRHPG